MTDSGASSYHLNLKDPGALEYWVHTCADSLIRYAYSIVGSSSAAEDAMEDAFAAMLVKGGKFHTPQQLRAWLFKTTHNKAVDYLRHHKREVPLCDVENVLHSSDLETDLIYRQRNDTIYVCMQRLPVQYRQVLVLTYFDEFEISQLCTILGKTKKQIYNLLARAKASLKELLMEEGITHEEL